MKGADHINAKIEETVSFRARFLSLTSVSCVSSLIRLLLHRLLLPGPSLHCGQIWRQTLMPNSHTFLPFLGVGVLDVRTYACASIGQVSEPSPICSVQTARPARSCFKPEDGGREGKGEGKGEEGPSLCTLSSQSKQKSKYCKAWGE